jgi:hypothetical protein
MLQIGDDAFLEQVEKPLWVDACPRRLVSITRRLFFFESSRPQLRKCA